MNVVNNLSTLFETYRGHDQTLALIGYGSKMMSGWYATSRKNNPKLSAKFQIVSSQISNARTILRLLDDASMLSYTLTYGLGKHEKRLIVRLLSIASNLASHGYYICEHIAWLADNKVIEIDSAIYWFLSVLCWFIYLVSALICHVINLRNLFHQLGDKKKIKKSVKKILLSKRFVILFSQMLEDICWTINAVHWLPAGFLWSSQLSDFTSGLLGVISVSCYLFRKTCP